MDSVGVMEELDKIRQQPDAQKVVLIFVSHPFRDVVRDVMVYLVSFGKPCFNEGQTLQGITDIFSCNA